MTYTSRAWWLTPLGVLATLLSGCHPACTNTVQQRTIYNDSLAAVVFLRGCGATTGMSTNVSIVHRVNADPDGLGNVLVMKDPTALQEREYSTRLVWLAHDTLQVSVTPNRQLTTRVDEVDGVTVVLHVRDD